MVLNSYNYKGLDFDKIFVEVLLKVDTKYSVHSNLIHRLIFFCFYILLARSIFIPDCACKKNCNTHRDHSAPLLASFQAFR